MFVKKKRSEHCMLDDLVVEYINMSIAISELLYSWFNTVYFNYSLLSGKMCAILIK